MCYVDMEERFPGKSCMTPRVRLQYIIIFNIMYLLGDKGKKKKK